MRRTPTRTLGAIAFALALVASACGSDDAETASDTASDAASDVVDEATDDTEAADDEPAVDESASDAAGCDAVDLSATPDAPVTIRMGHGAGTEEPLYLLAIDGVDVGSQYNGTHYTLELTEYAPPDRLAAYQAGAMDGGTISAPQLFTAVDSGLNIMVAASIAVVAEDNGFVFPYGGLEGEIEEGADINGLTIGIIAPNTATEYWAKSYAASLGLDANRDVSYVPVPVPNAEQAVRDGQVDVQMFTASFWGQAQAEGGLVTVFDALSGPGFDHEFLDIFFDRGFVEENTVAYCAWRADYAASMDAFIADRESYGQALIDNGFDPAPTAEIFNGRADAGRASGAQIDVVNLQLLIDDMKAIEFLAADVDITADDLLMDGFSLTK